MTPPCFLGKIGQGGSSGMKAPDGWVLKVQGLVLKNPWVVFENPEMGFDKFLKIRGWVLKNPMGGFSKSRGSF